MQELLIETIRTDAGVQSRAAINAEYVTELADILKAGRKLPPIDVYRGDTETFAADGFHRLAAHVQAGKRTIRANVHKGTREDAAWASCGANQEHGLRRTNADKRHAVAMAVKLRPDMSVEALADHCGVHRDLARSAKQQVVGNRPPDQRPTHVVGKDGKTYKVPPPPMVTRKIPPPPPISAPTPPLPPAPSRAPLSERVDEIGKPIPDHLTPLFDRAGEVQELLTAISRVKGVLTRGQEAGDHLYAEVAFNQVFAALETAYDSIKATTPYAVCPWCHGQSPMRETCRGCGTRGVIGDFRYKTAVPRELKA